MGDTDILQELVEEGVIDAVLSRLMSGKEAAVFIVERQGERIAAKVYKDREQRTFKTTTSYTEGRNQTRNTRDKRAMHKRSSYGKELIDSSWRDMEYAALHAAWQAGVRVPEPILLYENVLLMQLLVDENDTPAPRLSEFDLSPEVAALLHREIYGQVRLLLLSGRVHGDLSAFNILVARDGPTLIDLPQVVDASANSQAAQILHRDLKNVTEHLARFDPQLLRFTDCGAAMWRHFHKGTLDAVTEPEVNAPVDGSRARRGHDRPRTERPRHDGPRQDGPRHDGPHRDGPRHDGPRHDGPRHEGAHADARRGPPPQRQQQPQQEQRRDDARRGPPPQHPRDEQRRGPPPQQQHPRDEQRRGPPPQQQHPRDQQRRGPPPQQQPRDPQRRGPPPQQQPRDQQRRGPAPAQQHRDDRRGPPPHDQRRGPPARGPTIERVPTVTPPRRDS